MANRLSEAFGFQPKLTPLLWQWILNSRPGLQSQVLGSLRQPSEMYFVCKWNGFA